MKVIAGIFGPSFILETLAAGLGGLPIGMSPTEVVYDDAVLTPAQVVTLQGVVDSHDAAFGGNKLAKLQALAAQYQAKLAAGRSYAVPGDATGAHLYQIDDVPTTTRPSSQEQIHKVATQADRVLRSGSAAGTPWDAAAAIAFFFQDAANNPVSMTAQQAYDFATAMGQYCTGLALRSLQLKNAILAAGTQAALDAIDVTAGWPA